MVPRSVGNEGETLVPYNKNRLMETKFPDYCNPVINTSRMKDVSGVVK